MKTLFMTLGLASALWGQNERDVLTHRIRTEVGQMVAGEARATFGFVSAQMVSGPPVKGAPYSAEAVNETLQTLADGNRIVQRTSAKQFRDIDGRERREETSAMGVIFITDPVAGARYTLHPDSLTAEKGPMPTFNTASVPGVPVGRGGPGTFSVAVAGPRPVAGVAGVAAQDVMYVNAGSITKIISPGDAKTEQLGNMYIDGVQAQGTRTTTTIPAGEIGNDRPINIVDEQWYSPDLQMTVLTKHSDPRMGETNFALKNINRSSPPSYLFEIPAGYTVKTGPQPVRVERRE
jgi:hypothetical protein